MWVERVTARAFGALRDQSLDLGPGLNVIYGPNEAGKSTWHGAIRMALTGVRRGRGSATKEASALEDRHRPWDDRDRWAVEALVHVGDRRIDIVQDLLGKVACRATDVDLGIDVSAEITRPDGTPDASIWLGLDREAFATTVSVGQGEMLAVADSAAALQEHMQRAAAAHGTDATAAGAIERLREHRKRAVGADTAVAKGPLRTAMREVAARETELADARRRHAEYLARQADADAAASALATAERQLTAVRLAAARTAATDLRRRSERASELAARYPSPPPPLAARDEQADAVAAALAAWRSRPTPAVAAGRSVGEIEVELTALPEPPNGDVQPAATVVAALRELGLSEEAERAIGEAERMPSANARASGAGPTWALVGVAVLLTAGVVALIAGAPLVAVGATVLAVLLGAWLAVRGRRPRTTGQQRSRGDLLLEAQARTAAARAALARALRDRGVEPEDDLLHAAAEYEAACRARAGQAAAAETAPGLHRELNAARDAERLTAESERLGVEAEAGLRAALAQVTPGGDRNLPTAAVEDRLGAWQRERSATTAEAERSIREYEELSGLLNGRSVDDLAADVERSDQLVDHMTASIGPELEAMNGIDEATAAAEVDRMRQAAAALSGAAETRQADLLDVASAEEAATAAHERLRKVNDLAEVIDETLGLLEAAQRQVHRNLAPILAAAIREWLPLISGGAYVDAGVNPADLSIEVKERGTGAWRQARLLSGGTREQIYLLLRVAMAEHLVTTREKAPLLLDEVTAQADNDRERAILDMLLALATERQLILFTHDDAVLSWAESHLRADRHRIVRLSSPSGPRVDESADVITVGSRS